MAAYCPEVVQQLRQEILLRQGCKPPSAAAVDMGLGPVAAAFPHGVFPTGTMHELLSDGPEGASASGAFASALLGPLMVRGGACIWIGARPNIFPPVLAAFGVEPDRVIFVDVRREKDGLWAVEEALKVEGLAAVVGEIREVNFLVSRRFQLAVEQSRVTGFLLRDRPRSREPIATVARWQITPLPGGRVSMLPGVGFPRWSVELLRIRGGQPGKWELEWREGKFHFIGDAEAAGVGDAGAAGVCDAGAAGVGEAGSAAGGMAGTAWAEKTRRKTG
ncbi:MAG TPA: Error-prone repair protein ImuA [Puia sp.]|jgi:protein ImuA|nr:Error-prone repair protein ImuA [Puia sp.]